jgi:mRNA-degrading endonuclease RelE of RelBE toxin-antitoxin system
MSYSINIRKRALKEIEKLPTKNSIEISKAIDKLSAEPPPGWKQKIKRTKRNYVENKSGRLPYFIYH